MGHVEPFCVTCDRRVTQRLLAGVKSTANSYAVTLAERDTGNERRMQRRHMFALRAFASPSNLLTSAFGDGGVHEAYAAA